MLRVLLAQQWQLVRGALALVLAADPDLKIVAEASTQDEALDIAAIEQPDLVVVHHALPGPLDIRDLCVELQHIAPEVAVLVVADRCAASGLTDLLTAARPRIGLVATESSPAALVDGARRIVAGEPVFDVVLAVSVLSATDNPLTERERLVLRQAFRGAPVSEIAAQLFLSAGTIRNYLSRAVSKTGARTRIEAVRIAHEAGWI